MKLFDKIIIAICIVGLFCGCKKFVTVPPPNTQLVGASVYSTNATASAAVTGIFQNMVNGGNTIGGGHYGLSALLGLSCDEFELYPTSWAGLNETYTNSLVNNTYTTIWSNLYYSIYQANAAIEGISASAGINTALKEQLVGEAKFVRAFCYFYLVNIYGDVPLANTTNYKENGLIGRSAKNLVYDQIVVDLQDAKNLLNDNYLDPTGTVVGARVRPNKGAATALLSRVYLFQQKWLEAEIEATAVINNAGYQLMTDLNKAFFATDNLEAIWQLETPNTGFNTPDGGPFADGFNSASGPSDYSCFLLSDSIYNKFETGDLRKLNWTASLTMGTTTYHFTYKYKLSQYTGAAPVEYPVVIRLSEIYLIRAEARAQLGDVEGAQQDLNEIRNRAGLENTAAYSQSDLLNAIYTERRLELFTEYGHRWLDLKRTGLVDDVMSVFTPRKGGEWQTTDQLYPIPLSELQANSNLTQNPNY